MRMCEGPSSSWWELLGIFTLLSTISWMIRMNESIVAYKSTAKVISEIKMIKIISFANDYVMLALRRRFLQMRWGLENDCDYELPQDGMHRWSDLDFYFVFAKTWKDWMMGFAPMMILLLVWTLHKSLRCQWQSGGRKVFERESSFILIYRAFEALLTKMQSCFLMFLRAKVLFREMKVSWEWCQHH